MALGIFCGIAPFWGFQTLITISLAVLFRLNKSLAFLGSNVSIPPLIPIIIWSSLKIGSFFIHDNILPTQSAITTEFIKNHLLQYLIGSFILAFVSASFLGTLSYLLLKFWNKNSKNKH